MKVLILDVAADFITESNSGEGTVLDACLKIIEKFGDKNE